MFNPTGDGNCGFRCLAKSLGYNKDGWFQVREDLAKEASKNKCLYSREQGGEAAMRKLIEDIHVESKESEIEKRQWLSKLSHGQIIANTYSRPIVFLGLLDSLTFLPLCSYPSGESDPIYLLHVNKNHWVLANVQGKEGVKPISPIFFPKRATSKICKAWKDHLQKGFSPYEGLNPSL